MNTSARVNPDGRKLLRVEKQNLQTPIETKPAWIKTTAGVGKEYEDMRRRVQGASLHTVCAEANCPNIYECWQDREASFLIGGDICTRRCDFCFIKTGRPTQYDRDEPRRIAEQIRDMNLNYSTVTGVTRDDLPDGASWLYAETCRRIHELSPHTGVELLIDDMRGGAPALQQVFDSRPEVLAHNLETVPRIFKKIRPAFRYERSLDLITFASENGLLTKSNLILGMGETFDEVISAMEDLHEAGCDILTLTQYLRPSPLHHPIDRWVKPGEFVELTKIGYGIGFAGIMAGPLVRSSYRSGTLWARAMKARNRPIPPHLAGIGNGDLVSRQEASSVLYRMRGRERKTHTPCRETGCA
ncbi:lipoyl synthase [Arcanobacterium sp. S3PF19]|uniref:lipoyl synthase n=1 Tax=Arcanobacterium sp. S3PF19 TaxID=1219585 RepID=UPI000510117B|nr:lipoyl synthase [Arcanobacterium sp. S3PF19]KGF05900.1 radical SAM protein [Arcanobacterium sp. S3PF19]